MSPADFSADDYEALCRLDDSVENRKGASQAEINALPVHVGALVCVGSACTWLHLFSLSNHQLVFVFAALHNSTASLSPGCRGRACS